MKIQSLNRPWIIVSCLVLANLIMKMFFISTNSYWFDEVSQVHISSQSLGYIFNLSLETPNGPVYSIILRYWMQLFGVSELSTRLLSVLFYTLAIPVLYNFAAKFWNQRTAILVSVFFIASHWQTYFAHEVRSYAFITLLVISSFYLFYQMLERLTLSRALLYIGVTSLLFFTHLTPIIIVPIQGVLTLFYFKKPRHVFLMWGTMLVPILFLMVWFFNNQWFGGNETVWLLTPNSTDLLNMFGDYFNTKLVFYIFLVGLLFWGLKTIFDKKLDHLDLGPILWGIIPILVIYFSSIYYNPRFIHRYMLYAIPGLYLALSIFIDKATSKSRLSFITISVIVSLIMFSQLNLKFKRNGEWRAAVERIKEIQTDNDVVITIPNYTSLPILFYYDIERFNKMEDSQKDYVESPFIASNNPDYILNQIEENVYNKIFLVNSSHSKIFDPQRRVLSTLIENYPLIETSEDKYRTVELYCFDGSRMVTKSNQKAIPLLLEDSTSLVENGVYLLDTTEKFSGIISDVAKTFVDPNSVFYLEAEVYTEIADPNIALVVSVESKENNRSIAYAQQSANAFGWSLRWNTISIGPLVVGDLADDDLLKIYFWNTSHHDKSVTKIRNLVLKINQ